MEGGSSNGTSCLLPFGENSGGLYPMMMVPLVTSHHAGHHQINPHNLNHNCSNSDTDSTINANTNCLFLPMPSSSTNDHHHHPNSNNSGGNPSIMLENNHNTSANNNSNTGIGYYFMESDHNNSNNNGSSSSSSSSVKAKIMAHPHYHRLLAAYVSCQKVGAPPEVVARLEEACASEVAVAGDTGGSACLGEDPALDQFMEAYCEMLTKYEQELSKPLKEAMLFLQRFECQFKNLTISSSDLGLIPNFNMVSERNYFSDCFRLSFHPSKIQPRIITLMHGTLLCLILIHHHYWQFLSTSFLALLSQPQVPSFLMVLQHTLFFLEVLDHIAELMVEP